MTLTRTRADQLISSFAGKRILVLGDIMLDEFIWGKVRRISPEAPVPVVEVTRESYHLGGAGNVAANISALGRQSRFPSGSSARITPRQRMSEIFSRNRGSNHRDWSPQPADRRP